MSTSATVQFLLVLAAKVTLLLGIAAIVDLAMLRRYASASARHVLWTLAVVASLLLPILSQTLPAVRAPISDVVARLVPPPPHPATVFTRAPVGKLSRDASLPPLTPLPDAAPSNSHSSTPEAAAPVRAPRGFSYTTVLLVVYLAGVLVVVVRIAVDHAVVWRITREARPVRDARWTDLLRSLDRRSRIRRPVVMLRSPTSVMPLTCGLVRPRVVVPHVADSWPPTMREAVVLHELAHIDRGDCLTQSLAAIACALYWPNPLAWWAAARLRIERELACDDRVLARGVTPHEYAAHLLDAARALRTPRLAVSMAAAGGLEHRLRAVIDETRRREVPAKRSVALAAGSTLALVGSLGAVRPVRVETAAPPFSPRQVPSVSRLPAAPPVSVQRPSPESLTMKTRTTAAMPARGVPPGAMPAAPTVPQTAPGGTFSVRPATPADGPANAGRIHVMLQTPGLNTFYVEPSKIDGLTREQLAVVGAPLQFRLRRDAGTFEFTGTVRSGYGVGRFEFLADPAFADSLARRGVRAPSADQQFSLARHDVSLAYVDELVAQGYAVPTIEQLVHAGTTGADLEYVREMAALGYRERTVDRIIRLSNQGVDPTFIRELAALGYRGLNANGLVALRNQGVDAAFIKEANVRAGRTLDVVELVQYRNTGSATAVRPAPRRENARRRRLRPRRAKRTRSSSCRSSMTPSSPAAGRWLRVAMAGSSSTSTGRT